MTQKALTKYQELVDKIDTAYRIGPTEGEAVLEDCGPKLEIWMDRMDKAERKQASAYLKKMAKQHKAFRIGEEENMDDEDVDEDCDEEEDQEGSSPRWRDIKTDRRRELTNMAMEMSSKIDLMNIAESERCFFMAMLDNMV